MAKITKKSEIKKLEAEIERLKKECACCGRKIKVILYKDRTYRGGHYFGKILNKTEYWECPKCYWQ